MGFIVRGGRLGGPSDSKIGVGVEDYLGYVLLENGNPGVILTPENYFLKIKRSSTPPLGGLWGTTLQLDLKKKNS